MALSASGATRVRLDYRPPLATGALFGFLAARAIPGVEVVNGHEYRRAVLGRSGDTVLRLRPARGPASEVELEIGSAEPDELDRLVSAARRLLDLDVDPLVIDAALARDPVLRPLVAASPGRRVPGAFDGFASTVLAILAQGVTLASARTLAGRIARRHGRPVDLGDPAIDRRFPEPAVLAEADLADVGLTGRRAATIRALAGAVADGRLDLDPSADHRPALEALSTIPGIGPWTTAYVALRVFGDRDACPPGDAAVRAAFRRLGLPADPASIAARAEAWRPWRGYAIVHLWSTG